MAANKDIIRAVTDQIGDLKSTPPRQIRLEAIEQQLKKLSAYVAGQSADADKILADDIVIVVDILSGSRSNTDLGVLLGDLDTAGPLLNATATPAELEILQNIISQVETILSNRPDVQSVLSDLEALKSLKGGPADATAFHDFHVLQIAFKSVWKHVFSQDLQYIVEQVYQEHTKLYEDAGVTMPPIDAIEDARQLDDLKRGIETSIDDLKNDAVPPEVVQAFPAASEIWPQLSGGQRFSLYLIALYVLEPTNPPEQVQQYTKTAQEILKTPDGAAGRLTRLIMEMGRALNEPYAFDVFAPNSYNFGIMSTYRQKWEPGAYQAGDLISTIPLAPGEVRKYSKKVNVKRSRSEKEIEKSMSSSSYQSSETNRAEAEIMKKASTATNFKMSVSGSFNIGIGSIDSSSEFAASQAQESISNKKEFHEATIKAAQEYRLERSVEVDTSQASEYEDLNSGEISNPNNEITVTYLFYELQRQYLITEFLYRVRPVILVALDVPAPHEIDEAWLIQYQWIISRVLLDDSFRSALNYLSTGFAGEEVALDIVKAQWDELRKTVVKMEGEVTAQLTSRTDLRDYLVQSQLQEKVDDAENKFDVANFLLNPFQDKAGALEDLAKQSQKKDIMEANRDAADTRLKYVEQALADAQEKYRQSSGAFQQATRDYGNALQNQYSRHTAIDQLRIHVKQNILYYMQAIWAHRVSDQTFFELYKLPVECPKPGNLQVTVTPEPHTVSFRTVATLSGLQIPTQSWGQQELVDIADIDNPLGFKGNYIILPLRDDFECSITALMMNDFLDEFTKGLRDPDKIAYFLENFDDLWLATETNTDGTENTSGKVTIGQETFDKNTLRDRLGEYVATSRRTTDEIIIPTGQLFIEALPGAHPLLEDFKLLHRVEDVRKVRAEVRHAELENLRLAARLYQNQDDSKKDGLLDDPDIEKKVVVQGSIDIDNT